MSLLTSVQGLNITIPILQDKDKDATNFRVWKNRLLCHATNVGYISALHPPTEGDKTKTTQQLEQEELAKINMWQFCDPALFERLLGSETTWAKMTAYSILTTLETYFTSSSFHDKILAFQHLQELEQSFDQFYPAEYAIKAKAALENLSNHGSTLTE
ncbi:hypothetical protein HOO65_030544 [Ceratocystis lukuohia]|uniref:Uncharacterized protein n=1 Tax=Ceratocystis lukuohia TaxID=2019550 RepID=A0ABR4ML73_9PEZI